MSRRNPSDVPQVRTWPIPVTGVAILLAFCVLSVYEPRFLKAISLQTYDTLLSANASQPISGKVVLVDVDDDSIRKIGQWPWSRHTVARLADQLWNAQTAVLAFDIGFTEPDRLSPANAFAFWRQALPEHDFRPETVESLPSFDEMFARSLARGPSVLGFYIQPSDEPLLQTPENAQMPWHGTHFEKGNGRSFLPQGRGIPFPPLSLLRDHARLGCFNATPDQDNIVRRAPLVFAIGPERTFLSLAMEAFRLYKDDPSLGIQYDSEGVAGVVHLQLGSRIIPTDANARLILNYRRTRFPVLSAVNILNGDFDPELVRDHIVIVGSSAVGLFDIYSTPVHREIPGAEIQATIVDNLLAGDMLVEPRWLVFADLAVLLFGGLILIGVVSRTRALFSMVLLLLALSIPLGLSVYLLRVHHWVYLPSNVVVGWALAVIGVTLVKYWQKEIIADFDAKLRAVNRKLQQEIVVRTAAENEAQTARAAALRAAAAKSEFLANMSHEIRTPMNAVMGLCDIALRAVSIEKQRECLGKIGHSARALLRIINDILDFSKLEAGKLTLENLNFDLFAEVEELADLLGPQAIRKQIELVIDCPLELPRGWVGDSLRLRQVLINLVANAIKFTERGSVILRVESVPDPVPHELDLPSRLRFSVIDTGIGLSEEQQTRLFQAFQQADSSTTRKYGGTGLGLAISQTLVHLMGGEIQLTSQLGEGSTFQFTLPFQRQPQGKESSRDLPEELHGRTVFLVGENSLTLEMIERTCRSLHLEPQMVCEPLALSSSGAPDLVILDATRIENAKAILESLEGSIPQIVLYTPQLPDPVRLLQNARRIQRLDMPIKLSDLLRTLLTAWGYKPYPISTPWTQATEIPEQIEVLQNARVLLVDDNVINREIATENMVEFGIVVESVPSGTEAIEKAKDGEWDLILMDVQMPVISGYEATRAIREMEKAGQTKRPRTPIVAMTAHTLKEDEEACTESGMDGFVSKPLELKAFLEMLIHHVAAAPVKGGLSTLRPASSLPPRPVRSEVILDEPAALARVRGNRALHRRLLDDFLSQHRGLIPRMGDAIQSGDVAQARDWVHNIKGSAANLGALRIFGMAVDIESQLRKGQPPQALALLAPLEEAFDDLRTFLSGDTSWIPAEGSPGSPASLSVASIQESLGVILPLLRQGNMRGMDQMEALLPVLRQAGLSENDFQQVRHDVAVFDCGRLVNWIERWMRSNDVGPEILKIGNDHE